MRSSKEKFRQQRSPTTFTQKKGKTKSKSPKKHSMKQPATTDFKTLLCEITRLKGQQKLLYVKQAKQKELSDEYFFNDYPYCQLQSFTFDVESLRADGKIIRNQKGLHWVQCLSPHAHGNAPGKQQFNGWAISILNDGKIFEGTYHDSEPCGKGYQLHPSGNTYIGSFKQGLKSGSGTYYWFSSGEMYSGEWSCGLPHGTGKYLSGDYYEGQFSNGLKYGNGQEVFVNGDMYVGEYINGVADGYGEYYWVDGSVYKGDFKHGVRHGYGLWTDKNQTEIYSGCYRMDKKQGFGVYEWVGKQSYKGQFRQDFRQGYGRLSEITYKPGHETSETRQLDEKVLYQGMWVKGKQKFEQPVDKDVVKRLQVFLSENKLNSPQKRKRIGHENCIPKANH